MIQALPDADEISRAVSNALKEDMGTGDITAALIPADSISQAQVICREEATICGTPWFDEVFRQVDPNIQIKWAVRDGERVAEDTLLCRLNGVSRNILTAERAALNFLQTLSGTASIAHSYAQTVKHLPVKILDTRKTIPGLRMAQKYAVACGGCHNHRFGLWDAFLIKENHIAACGSIGAAITAARTNHPEKLLEVEVESIQELEEALQGGADRVMLDNFTLEDIKRGVAMNQGRADLEVSGNVEREHLEELGATGVDYISVGALTKHCRAIDLSLRID